MGVSIHMNSRNGSFGFQVFGGADVGSTASIELVVPGGLTHNFIPSSVHSRVIAWCVR